MIELNHLKKRKVLVVNSDITNKNTAVSKETIIEKLWGYDSEAEDNHAEIHISLLRKKLKQAGSVLLIKAIRGIGYIIKYPEEESAC